jgi:hypothetical protein
MPAIQLKVAGGWRHVVNVEEATIDYAHSIVQATLRALRIAVVARLVSTDGQVEDHPSVAATDPWRPITDDEPAPLHDVIVTVMADLDHEPLTFMAYRKAAGSDVFYVSGTPDERLVGAYAFCAGPEAAPLSMRKAPA